MAKVLPVNCVKNTHRKLWLPVVIHEAKTRNNALDVVCGLETIIMPLPRHPQTKSFCLMPHALAPDFTSIFFTQLYEILFTPGLY